MVRFKVKIRNKKITRFYIARQWVVIDESADLARYSTPNG
jgi:hypothetical protein